MRYFAASIFLLWSAHPGFSQGEKINFRTLALSDAKFPQLWAIEAAKAQPLDFPSSQPSEATRADRTSPLRIYKGPLDDKGKPVDTAPSLVNLPASASILLLGWMDGEKPNFLAIEDPFATMRHDDWLIVNSTPKLVAVQIGEKAKPEPVKPHSFSHVRSTAPAGTGAAVTIATQVEGGWKAFYSSYWPIYDDKRGLVLLVQSGEQTKVKYITDQIAPKPAAKP